MAADRVARGRERADQILAFDLPEDMSFRRLVDFAELRWRIERDYQELKQEGSAILKGEDGAASTTTPRSDERETIDLVAPGRSRHLRYPTVTTQRFPPLRPERHIPNSIATVRRRLIAALVSRLPRCPCCAAPIARRMRRQTL